MPNKKYKVRLTDKEYDFLQKFVSSGKHSAREVRRANILLLADRRMTDKEIHDVLHVSTPTVQRTREKYVTGGLDKALYELLTTRTAKKAVIHTGSADYCYCMQ